MCASLQLIIGPMFAGKTTELIRRLTTFKKAKLRVIYINSNLDSRSDDLFSTHNTSLSEKQEITMIKTKSLMEVYDKCKEFDVIAVDEAQFFTDLFEFYSRIVEVECRNLIVAGLNGTSDREKFGHICDLIPHADSVEFIYPFCSVCADQHKITKAIFSKRICSNGNTVCVGGDESYIPVCREHFRPVEYDVDMGDGKILKISKASGKFDYKII